MKFASMLIALHLVTTTPAAANKGSLRALTGDSFITENEIGAILGPGDGTIKEGPGDGIIKEGPGGGIIKENPGDGIIKENPGDGTIKENPGDFIEKPIIKNPGEGEVIGLPPKLSPEKCQQVCHDCKDTESPNPEDVDEPMAIHLYVTRNERLHQEIL
jgi:hypothetical protein